MDRWTDLALVAHEVGGALTPARNALALLQQDPPAGLDSRQQRLMNILARSLERTDRVLGNLTSIALPDSHAEQVEICRPQEWLRPWLEPFAEQAVQRNQRLDVDIAEGTPAFPTDLFRLEQVLANLLGNALKFTPAGGHVRLTLAPCRGTVLPGRMLLLAGGFGFRPRFLQFAVEDSGIGIGAETRRHLFQPFYRGREARQHAGTGLGLTVARHLVQRLHGDLRAEDVPAGARFVLTLAADAATRELCGNIDALYTTLRRDLEQDGRSLLVARTKSAAQASSADARLHETAAATGSRLWRLSSTTWVLSGPQPVRSLYRDLAARVASGAAGRPEELHVHVRRAGRAAPVDELVLQSVVRCRQPIAAGVLQGSQPGSRTEVA